MAAVEEPRPESSKASSCKSEIAAKSFEGELACTISSASGDLVGRCGRPRRQLTPSLAGRRASLSGRRPLHDLEHLSGQLRAARRAVEEEHPMHAKPPRLASGHVMRRQGPEDGAEMCRWRAPPRAPLRPERHGVGCRSASGDELAAISRDLSAEPGGPQRETTACRIETARSRWQYYPPVARRRALPSRKSREEVRRWPSSLAT